MSRTKGCLYTNDAQKYYNEIRKYPWIRILFETNHPTFKRLGAILSICEVESLLGEDMKTKKSKRNIDWKARREKEKTRWRENARARRLKLKESKLETFKTQDKKTQDQTSHP